MPGTGAGGTAGSGAGGGPPPPCGDICGATLAIDARHLVYDASRDRVYVSVQGGAARYPNTITEIDPKTAQVASTIPVGSDPNVLALSSDSSTLWVGMDGSFSMRGVSLASSPPVAGPLRRLPDSPTQAGVFVRAMISLPDSPNTVVASAAVAFGSSLAVYDDGVPRPMGLSGTAAPALMAAGPLGTFFGVTSTTLDVVTVSATGMTQAAFANLITTPLTGTMSYASGRVYAGSDVIDVSNPSAPVHVGAFTARGTVAPHSPNRVVMLSPATQSPGPWVLRLLDSQSLTERGSIAVPTSLLAGQPSPDSILDVTYVGGDTVALLANSSITGPYRVVLLHAALLANDGANPDGGAGGAGGGGGTGVGGSTGSGGAPGATCAGCTLQRVDVPAFHMIYDGVRSRLYAVNTYDAAHDPNSLVPIDATTGTPLAVVSIDPNPRQLALSDDGNTLWVGFDGTSVIRKFSLASTPPVAGTTIPLSGSPYDLLAIPGSPTSIALCGGGTAQVTILDDGVARPTIVGSGSVFVTKLAAGPAGALFGYDGMSSAYTFSSYATSASGVTRLSARQGLMGVFQNDIHYSQGRIYADWGEVIYVSNLALPVRAGKYAWNGIVTPRSSNRIMMLTEGEGAATDSLLLRILETDNFTQVASLAVGKGFSGTISGAADLFYIGGDGVAFVSPGLQANHNVFIFRSPTIAAPP